MDLKTLSFRPGREPDNRRNQEDAGAALIEGHNFELVNLLAGLRSRRPYQNYTLPEDFQEFTFSVKGLARLELMAIPAYKKWRWLFGASSTKTTLRTWRSRVLVQTFEDWETARTVIMANPLLAWPGVSKPELPETQPAGWFVLFQIHDLYLAARRQNFSDLMAQYLRWDSQIFRLVHRWSLGRLIGGPS